MTHEQEFFTRLTALAKACNATLTPDIVELYDQGLKDLGYKRVADAIVQVFMNRRSGERMPSIRDLRELVCPEVSPDHEAIEAASRIAEAMARFGYDNPTAARKFIGELGWKVVEREGNWRDLCGDVKAKDIPIRKAQWRETAKALIARAKAGKLTEAPKLPEGPQAANVVRLSARIGKEMAAGGDS